MSNRAKIKDGESKSGKKLTSEYKHPKSEIYHSDRSTTKTNVIAGLKK